MSKIKCLIVEDMPDIQETIKNIVLKYHPNIEIIGVTGFADAAIEMIKLKRPQLLLMDIELHDKTSFDILTDLREQRLTDYSVIFITSHFQYNYAKEAITYTNLEYVEKPIDKNILSRTINEAVKNIGRNTQKEQIEHLLEVVLNYNTEFNKIVINDASSITSRTIFFDPEDIIYFQTEKDSNGWTQWHINDGRTIRSNKSIKEYESRLNFEKVGFFRIDQSTVINKRHLKEYHKNYKFDEDHKSQRGACVIMKGDKILKVSKRYKTSFFEKVSENKLNWIQNILKKFPYSSQK